MRQYLNYNMQNESLFILTLNTASAMPSYWYISFDLVNTVTTKYVVGEKPHL